jgi:hypothetical protein
MDGALYIEQLPSMHLGCLLPIRSTHSHRGDLLIALYISTRTVIYLSSGMTTNFRSTAMVQNSGYQRSSATTAVRLDAIS